MTVAVGIWMFWTERLLVIPEGLPMAQSNFSAMVSEITVHIQTVCTWPHIFSHSYQCSLASAKWFWASVQNTLLALNVTIRFRAQHFVRLLFFCSKHKYSCYFSIFSVWIFGGLILNTVHEYFSLEKYFSHFYHKLIRKWIWTWMFLSVFLILSLFIVLNQLRNRISELSHIAKATQHEAWLSTFQGPVEKRTPPTS